MAKKHAKNAGLLIPDALPHAFAPAASRWLPASIRPLFLAGLIREAASGKHIDAGLRLASHEVFKAWAKKLEAGKLHRLTESEVEADFTGHLLVSLGYVPFAAVGPTQPYSLSPKWHVAGIGTADAVLGSFRFDESNVRVDHPLVVVELKGAGTDLDRRASRGRTPVGQAWDYLNATNSAEWAIVSNFEEVRLYNRRKGSNHLHRAFLVDLIDAEAFADFYAVFHAHALLGTGGFPQTASWLLSQTEEKQETVGNRLYEEYSMRRDELIREFLAKGRGREVAIAAAQKLLDRILFLAFAEDRGLLHSNKVLEETAALRFPRLSKWNNFQYLFQAIDQGDDRLDIPRYNGELFKADPVLDDPGLDLDDKWAQVFKGIGGYDFKDEVTVDVLGRIFEQSITDIERLKAGDDPDPPADDARKATGRRKLHGVFYTDASIVDYLIHAALAPAFEAEKARLAAAHGHDPASDQAPPAAFTAELLGWVDALAVCDPSCGSGAFLIAAYNWFEDHRIALLKDLRDARPDHPLCRGEPHDWRARSAHLILKNNLFGVDLSVESVEIARLSLWIRTARRGELLANLAENVVQGNSVVADPEVDPLAFAWPARFPMVFARGGFDAVVGNPPYVRQERLAASKPHFQAAYASYHGMADLYVYFYERGLSLLRPGGRLAYVVTNKWMKAGYGEPLRRHFGEAAWVESVVDFGHAKQFFKDADVFPCFLVARRPDHTPPPETARVCVISRDVVRLDQLKSQVAESALPVERTRFRSEAWQLEPKAVADLMDKIRRNGIPLAEYAGVKPYYGIKTGFNEAFLIDTPAKERLVREDPKSAEILKPYLRGQDIKRWSPEWAGLWMIALKSSGNYPWAWADAGDGAEAIFAEAFPCLYRHLTPHKKALVSRQDQGRYWWELRACAYWHAFDRPKIILPEITWHLQWCFDPKGFVCNNTVYIIDSMDSWILAAVNSPLNWCYSWRHAIHGKDEALRFIRDFVEIIPIPKIDDKSKEIIGNDVVRLQAIALITAESENQTFDWLKVEYEIAKPNTKLLNPTLLDSDAFVAEVKKARGKRGLSAAGLKALRDEYSRTIEPARKLADEAKALELQLHDLVNAAYGLTSEEVRLMWDTAPPRMPIARPTGI